ncbi:hypothetical protein BHE74_00051932 [Ensete ventricosum]|nr:hypothetical protein BHE74_00051932 [Ensete ventricosum]
MEIPNPQGNGGTIAAPTLVRGERTQKDGATERCEVRKLRRRRMRSDPSPSLTKGLYGQHRFDFLRRRRNCLGNT